MKSLDFELDFWDADGWLPRSEVMRAAFEVEDPWDALDPDLPDAVSVLLHRRPSIDRVPVW